MLLDPSQILEIMEWAEELDFGLGPEPAKNVKLLQERVRGIVTSFATRLKGNLGSASPANSILSLNVIEGLGGDWLSRNASLFNAICKLVYDITTKTTSLEKREDICMVEVGLECLKHVAKNDDFRGRVGKTWEELIKTVSEIRGGAESDWIGKTLTEIAGEEMGK